MRRSAARSFKAVELGQRRRAGAERGPVNAIEEAEERVEHLRAVQKAAGWVDDARLHEAEGMAAALAQPVSRALSEPPAAKRGAA